MLEVLRPEQSIDEIDHKPRGHERGKRVIKDHGWCPLQTVAGEGVGDRDGEESKAERDHDDIHHFACSWRGNGAPVIVPRFRCDRLTYIKGCEEVRHLAAQLNCHCVCSFSRRKRWDGYRNPIGIRSANSRGGVVTPPLSG